MGIHNNALIGSSGQGGDYNLTKSLRFRSSASAYLNRTFGSPTNNNKWTWSGWVKRGALGTNSGLFGAFRTTIGVVQCYFMSNDTLRLYVNDDTNTTYIDYQTSAVYRDPSAWYHVVISIDNTLSTTSALIYINGTQVTAFGTNTNTLVQNAGLAWNFNGSAGYIGQNRNTSNAAFGYFDGYLAELNFIDGQQLTPSSFGETSTTTGVWIPKKYTGTYGTNGFYLDFEDTSSTAALGYDAAGSNDWTVNGISLTAGSTYDSMNDVPTLTSATTANYCVMSPIDNGGNTLSNGNLTVVSPVGTAPMTKGTFGVSSGKWYWEVTPTALGSSSIGIAGATVPSSETVGTNPLSWGYLQDARKYNNTSATSYGSSYTTNDVIGIALDMDAGTLTYYKNNTSQGQAFSGITGTVLPALSDFSADPATTWQVNFGQQPFAYTPPTGFVALNTFNLPTPTIGATASTTANKYMDVLLHNGNGGSQSITGLNFAPDFWWVKSRNLSGSHCLFDQIRGANSSLFSELTLGENNNWTGQSFNSNGVTADAAYSYQTNGSGYTFVDWFWKANGAGSTNTAGSITSTVSANTTAGFSIATYTGNGTSGATVGHGLGVAPSMVIVKKRSGVADWPVQHISLGPNASLRLNGTNATANEPWWNSTAPSSTVFTLGNSNTINQSSETFVAYCFAPVAGYSAFGSYTGNGSSDGPFIYTGFRPRYVMIKRTDATESWVIDDSSRSPYNVTTEYLLADSSGAAGNVTLYDFLSNGFKPRGTSQNGSGATFIYMAFAETPFKYANAR